MLNMSPRGSFIELLLESMTRISRSRCGSRLRLIKLGGDGMPIKEASIRSAKTFSSSFSSNSITEVDLSTKSPSIKPLSISFKSPIRTASFYPLTSASLPRHIKMKSTSSNTLSIIITPTIIPSISA